MEMRYRYTIALHQTVIEMDESAFSEYEETEDNETKQLEQLI